MALRCFREFKYRNRFFFRGLLFIGIIGYTLWSTDVLKQNDDVQFSQRKLLQEVPKAPKAEKTTVVTPPPTPCPDPLAVELAGKGRIPEALNLEQIRNGGFILYFIGMMYMFLALSIVCDECFCPALDAATEDMKISPDVAGATLMAAGGSAPELATSFIGTFLESDVGFGTIVGSAVFNVLFVIGMCVLYSSNVLTLTWFPLFRDCTVYAIGLFTLAAMFTVITPGVICWWESLILLLMYLGYVLLMSKNEQIENWITKKGKNKKSQVSPAGVTTKPDMKGLPVEHEARRKNRQPFTKILFGKGLYRSPGDLLVRQIQHDMAGTFRLIDKDNSGTLTHDEFKAIMQENELDPTDDEINELIKELDKNNDNVITYEEFKHWYAGSEKRMYKCAVDAFNLVSEKRGTQELLYNDIWLLLEIVYKTDVVQQEVDDSIAEMKKKKGDEAGETFTREEFLDWYKNSGKASTGEVADNVHKSGDAEEEIDGLTLAVPDGCCGKIMYVISFPIVFPLYMTVPNVDSPKWKGSKMYIFSFFMAIVWVAIFSIFMVQWATVFGLAIKIPTKVMGLLFLAAGTSIPDLLTSVSVALAGKGDMAVSSSIGSNIFDILVGLPLPWFVRSLVINKSIRVGSPNDNVGVSVFILFAVVVIVILTVRIVNWKLTKVLASVFFFFYFLYVAQELTIYYTIGPGAQGGC